MPVVYEAYHAILLPGMPVSPQMSITTTSPLPGAQIGNLYSNGFTATGGSGTYFWGIMQDTGVNTWSFSGANLTGTPTTAETDTIIVQCRDSIGNLVTQPFSVTVTSSQAATPTFSPVAGNYTTAQTVTISCSTPSSTIYYTTNGTTPTTGSPVYSSPITVSTTETVQAIATAAGYNQSNVGSAPYTISAGTYINWNEGIYGLSYTQPVGQANAANYGGGVLGVYPGSAWAAEVSQCYTGYQTTNVNSRPTIVGHYIWTTWGGLEVGTSNPGVYQFQGAGHSTYFMDVYMNDIRTKGLKSVWNINFDVYNGSTPSAPTPGDTSIVPNYVLNNSATYGAPQYGSSGVSASGRASSGFYVQNAAWSGNITNANVRAAFLAMMRALATAYDGDVAFEGVNLISWDVSYPYAGCAAQSTFWASYVALALAVKSYFKKSNVWVQMGFGGSAQPSVQTLIQAGILCSASDAGGLTQFASSGIGSIPITWTGGFQTGSTSGTFTTSSFVWSGVYNIHMSTGQVLAVTATGNNYPGVSSTFTATWPTPITGSPTSSATAGYFTPNLQDGVLAYLNIERAGSGWTPPNPALYTYSSSGLLIEEGDIANPGGIWPGGFLPTVLDVINAANAAPAGGYGSSHLPITILPSGTTPSDAIFTNVITTAQANPLTTKGYPKVYGYDGVVQVSAAGLMVNGSGTPIMLRGANMGGLGLQSEGGYHNVDPWGSGGTPVNSEPNWLYYQTWKPNTVRIQLNTHSFAGVNIGGLTGTGTGPYTWSTVNLYNADPNGNYKACVLQAILQSRAINCYPILVCFANAPQFTDTNSVTAWMGSNEQSPFLDYDSCFPFWCSNNPSVGLVAWLATNFGSAAFNTANGFNSGAAGAYYNSAYGGASGFGDCIFELFNEPYFFNQEFTLTTLAGTFGNAAWKASNGGSSITTTNGGAPPHIPQNANWANDNTVGASWVKLYGGYCNWFYENGQGYSGPGNNRGIPTGATGAVGGGPGPGLDLPWQVLGYQQTLTGIRALGATNMILVNGDSYAGVMSSAPYWLPDDTVSPQQVGIGHHAYFNNIGSDNEWAGGLGPGSFGDPGQNTSSWFQIPTNVIGGTLPYQGGTMRVVPIVFTEQAGISSETATLNYLAGGTYNTQPDPVMTIMQNYIDAATLGGVGTTWYVFNTETAPYGWTAGQGPINYSMNILGPPVTFNATISNGSGGAGNILTLTSNTSGGSLASGMVLTGNSVPQQQSGAYLVALVSGSGSTTGSQWSLFISDASTINFGPQAMTANTTTTWPGMSQTNYTWMVNHV